MGEKQAHYILLKGLITEKRGQEWSGLYVRVKSSRSNPVSASPAIAHAPGNRTGTTSLQCIQGMPVNTVEEKAQVGIFDLKSGWIMYLSPYTIHWKINPPCSLVLSECMQRKHFVYTVKAEADVNTAKDIGFLHGLKQNLSVCLLVLIYYFNYEHKGSGTP